MPAQHEWKQGARIYSEIKRGEKSVPMSTA